MLILCINVIDRYLHVVVALGGPLMFLEFLEPSASEEEPMLLLRGFQATSRTVQDGRCVAAKANLPQQASLRA